jgi:hypothetical protein
MRTILLAATLVAIAPAAFAQMHQGTPQGMPMGDAANQPPPGASSSAMAGNNGTENCGTPDAFKACPPLPRHPLPYYPANKQ